MPNSTPHITAQITLHHLQKLKHKGEKITALTAYDATFANVLSRAGIEILLIGDTLGMVIGGHKTTLPVTLADIIYHTQNVYRANTRSFLIADMPFMSYYNLEKTLENAALLMQAGAQMVKLEGGLWLTPFIEQLTQQGIPTCVHLGLGPQSVHILGGYKVQGRDLNKAQEMLTAALQVEKAGANMIVLECVPYSLAQEISQTLTIPVIGIGAGPYCDGQILVTYDMLGLTSGKPLTFVQNFLEGQREGIAGAIKAYVEQVKAGEFPNLEQSFA